jgi:TIR domain
MATAWLTYAWKDNQEGDVDFIARELVRAGLLIKLDRWNLQPGRRLWEQIEKFITDPAECDGWIMYATQNSLASEACREELAYALDRALSTRGSTFPIIALVPSHVENGLLPAAIRTRLYVDLSDPDWKNRIVASVGNLDSVRGQAQLAPYVVIEHPPPAGFVLSLEVRPRAGVWHPFAVCVRLEEKDSIGLVLRDGPRGFVPSPTMGGFIGGGSTVSVDGKWHIEQGYAAGTPTHSYFLFCRQMPSVIGFGQLNTPGQMFFWPSGAMP